MEFQIPSKASPLVNAWHELMQNRPPHPSYEWPKIVLGAISKALQATFLGTLSVDNVSRYGITLNGHTTPTTWTPTAGWDIAWKPSWGGANQELLLIGWGAGKAAALAVSSVAFVHQQWHDLSWFLRIASANVPTVPKTPPSPSQLARQIAHTQALSDENMIEPSLEKLMMFLETQRPDLFAAVRLYHQGHIRVAAAPSLPMEYHQALNGMPIDPGTGFCGTAGPYTRPHYIADMAHDPRWQTFQWITETYGLAGCWSIPLLGAHGTLLGTLSCYCPEPRYPSQEDLEWIYLVRDWVVETLQPKPRIHPAPSATTGTPNLTLRHDQMGRILEVVEPGFLDPEQAQHLVGETIDAYVYPREVHRIQTAVRELSTKGVGHALFRARYDAKDLRSRYHWVHTEIVAEDASGERFLSTTRELTADEVKELLISGALMVDPVTDLPVLGFWATDALEFSRQFQRVALMVVEIDQFDLFSMAVGSVQSAKTLKALVTTIRDHLPARAIIAQINAGRLGILISDPDPGRIPTLFHDANAALRRRDRGWVPTISAGIVLVDYREDQMEQFLHQAVVALQEAQAAGGEQYRYYEPLMNATRFQSASFDHELRHALERGELFLVYQPIASSNKTWRIEGFEALVRWNHGTRGLITPADFIPVAERSGTILEIGAWVLEESLNQVRQWQTITQKPDLYVHVNVSARQLEDTRFPQMVMDLLKKTQFSPCQLKLEITESMLVKDLARVLDAMHQLRRVGISWSLDDFGTGYSSLAALRTLPIQVLKIDRSFVSSLQDKPTRAIVKTLIQLAKDLNLSIIAEGVEKDREWAELSRLGCSMLQGFLISRPLEPKTALDFLQRGIDPVVISR